MPFCWTTDIKNYVHTEHPIYQVANKATVPDLSLYLLLVKWHLTLDKQVIIPNKKWSLNNMVLRNVRTVDKVLLNLPRIFRMQLKNLTSELKPSHLLKYMGCIN